MSADSESSVSGRAFVAAGVALAIAFGGYLALGMPGMDHSAEIEADGAATEHHAGSDVEALDADSFAERVSDPAAFVVNVEVPPRRGIAGTDATVPFDDALSDWPRRPADRSTPVLVYSEREQMSRVAAEFLVDSGYGRVSYLAGGLDAWKQAGYDTEAVTRSEREEGPPQ